MFFVATSFALMWTMSIGRYHVKDIAPHKPLLTYNNIYPRQAINNRMVNSGQPMVIMGGALPPISPTPSSSGVNVECDVSCQTEYPLTYHF